MLCAGVRSLDYAVLLSLRRFPLHGLADRPFPKRLPGCVFPFSVFASVDISAALGGRQARGTL